MIKLMNEKIELLKERVETLQNKVNIINKMYFAQYILEKYPNLKDWDTLYISYDEVYNICPIKKVFDFEGVVQYNNAWASCSMVGENTIKVGIDLESIDTLKYWLNKHESEDFSTIEESLLLEQEALRQAKLIELKEFLGADASNIEAINLINLNLDWEFLECPADFLLEIVKIKLLGHSLINNEINSHVEIEKITDDIFTVYVEINSVGSDANTSHNVVLKINDNVSLSYADRDADIQFWDEEIQEMDEHGDFSNYNSYCDMIKIAEIDPLYGVKNSYN